MATTEPNAYLKTKVMTATPAELRMLLLDGAIRFAQQGRNGLLKDDHEEVYLGISQCREVVMELISALDYNVDPALCERLQSLYIYLYTRLMEVSRQRDIAIIDEVIELLQFERETWTMVMDKLQGDTTQANAAAASPAQQPDLTSRSIPMQTLPTPIEPKHGGSTVAPGLIGGTISVQG